MSELIKFDHYLSDDGPAALVIREWLMPVEGSDGVVFPATFAAGEDKRAIPGGYNIDYATGSISAKFTYQPWGGEKLESDVHRHPNGRNVCLVDSVGSQANRIEPIFMPDKYDGKYAHLVPQIVVTAGTQEVNLLEAGHRAGDALVRCSSLQKELQDAFNTLLRGSAEDLARIAPTSLVFGVWDSRDTQAKLPRVVASTIRAFDVRELKRGAVYTPPVDYAALEVFSEEDKAKAEGDKKSPLAQRGFVHVPASGSHGGVIPDGGIRRDATLGLAALRLLHVGKDKEKTLALRRYILGLALVAFTHNPSGYLRQGCLLVLDTSKPREFVEVYPTGERKPATVTNTIALKYATEVAKAFGVGASKTVPFDKERAKKDVKGEGDTKTKGKKGAKEKKVETPPDAPEDK